VTPEILLFALRLLGGLLLLLFAAALLRTIRQDMSLAASQVASRHHARGRLVIVTAGDSSLEVGQTFALLPVTSLGRAPSNTVHLADTYASNDHGLLSLRSGRWWLEDLGSSNGTTLNDQLLAAPAVVSSGDLIGIGRVTLKVEFE
jgi:hypothetical protein